MPSYVLEYLLGMYCATDNEDDIEQGVSMVKQVLANNFVRPDEAEKINGSPVKCCKSCFGCFSYYP